MLGRARESQGKAGGLATGSTVKGRIAIAKTLQLEREGEEEKTQAAGAEVTRGTVPTGEGGRGYPRQQLCKPMNFNFCLRSSEYQVSNVSVQTS